MKPQIDGFTPRIQQPYAELKGFSHLGGYGEKAKRHSIYGYEGIELKDLQERAISDREAVPLFHLVVVVAKPGAYGRGVGPGFASGQERITQA
jgi:hypothetical protein